MPLCKPATPVWQPSQAPAGCKLYLPIAEGAGTRVRDLAGSNHGTFFGTPSWQRGPRGPHLGDFALAHHVRLDPPRQILGAVYPHWHAVMASCTSASANLVITCQGSSTLNNKFIELTWNTPAATQVRYSTIADNGTTMLAASPLGAVTNDGSPHVVMAISRTPSDHRIYVQGLQVGSATTTLGTITNNQLALGVRRTTVTDVIFAGGSILAFAAGNGSVPDPMALAQDWLSGRFAAVRPRADLARLAAMSTDAAPPATLFRRSRGLRTGSRGAA